MNSSQPSLAPTTPATPQAGGSAARWTDDEEVALGCECADPVLQIERWSQESPQQMHRLT